MADRASRPGTFLRIAGRTAVAISVAIFLLFALVQLQQHLLRHRAERLIADVQSIRLNKSTWSDTQALMHRWGTWGHYNGQCDFADCDYQISLRDLGSQFLMSSPGSYDRLLRFDALQAFGWLYQRLGGRIAGINFQFKVQDGVIVQTRTEFDVESTSSLAHDKAEGSLVIIAQSRQSLNNAMGNNEQLARHPNYKVGRPGGCESCLMANISYTPQISQSEITRFTSFDLSCFTRFHECVILEQILPASREWHLYEYPWGETRPEDRQPPPSPPKPCDISVWALGRDAASAYLVDTISNTQDRSDPEEPHELDKVRILGTLRGTSPWDSTAVVTAFPNQDRMGPPRYLSEHLESGRRYIVLLD
jgi:hypothetical protein